MAHICTRWVSLHSQYYKPQPCRPCFEQANNLQCQRTRSRRSEARGFVFVIVLLSSKRNAPHSKSVSIFRSSRLSSAESHPIDKTYSRTSGLADAHTHWANNARGGRAAHWPPFGRCAQNKQFALARETRTHEIESCARHRCACISISRQRHNHMLRRTIAYVHLCWCWHRRTESNGAERTETHTTNTQTHGDNVARWPDDVCLCVCVCARARVCRAGPITLADYVCAQAAKAAAAPVNVQMVLCESYVLLASPPSSLLYGDSADNELSPNISCAHTQNEVFDLAAGCRAPVIKQPAFVSAALGYHVMTQCCN